MKNSIIFVLIISLCSNQIQGKSIPNRRPVYSSGTSFGECDLSIFAVPKFIYGYYLSGPHYMLKEFIRKTLKKRADPNGDTSADFLYWLLPFIAPLAAVNEIDRSFKCLARGDLKLTI